MPVPSTILTSRPNHFSASSTARSKVHAKCSLMSCMVSRPSRLRAWQYALVVNALGRSSWGNLYRHHASTLRRISRQDEPGSNTWLTNAQNITTLGGNSRSRLFTPLVSLDKNRAGTKSPNISKRLSRERIACTFFRVNLLPRPKRSGPKPDRKGVRLTIAEKCHKRKRTELAFHPKSSLS